MSVANESRVVLHQSTNPQSHLERLGVDEGLEVGLLQRVPQRRIAVLLCVKAVKSQPR